MGRNNRARQISPGLLPDPDLAVEMYRNHGGTLTDPAPYGNDPLPADSDKQRICADAFDKRYPSMNTIFHHLVNGNSSLFKEALLFYIDVTRRLSAS